MLQIQNPYKLTDQLDPYKHNINIHIKLIRNFLTDQLDSYHSRTTPPAHPPTMLTSFAADVEPTTATLHAGPFTFTEAQLSQQKLTPKTKTREKNDS